MRFFGPLPKIATEGSNETQYELITLNKYIPGMKVRTELHLRENHRNHQKTTERNKLYEKFRLIDERAYIQIY